MNDFTQILALAPLLLRVTDQSWQTRLNQSVLHIEVVFVVFWRKIGNLVKVVYIKMLLFFPHITQIYIITSYIDDIEPNLPIGKHTLRVFTWKFEKIVGKGLFWCFIYVFVSLCCISYHFYRFMLLNATLWLPVTHTFKDNGPKLAD